MSLERLTKQLKKEEGVTIVELLAAIAILSIIVTAFLAFFTQAGRTNNMTDEINEATFIAVEEMERVTNLSQQGLSFGEMKDTYKDAEDYLVDGELTPISITRVYEDGTTSIIIDKPKDEAGNDTLLDNLYRINVTVIEGGQKRAEMQSVLPFTE